MSMVTLVVKFEQLHRDHKLILHSGILAPLRFTWDCNRGHGAQIDAE